MITSPEESYRLWCVVICDLETSCIRRPWPTRGCRAKNNKLQGLTPKSSEIFPHCKFLMTNNTMRLFPCNRMKDWSWKMWDRYWSLRYYLHELQVSRSCHSRWPLPRRPFPFQAIPRKTCGGQKWYWERFYSEDFGFRLSVSFHQYPILICIWILLLQYQKDKRANPGNLQTKQCCFGYQGSLHTKVLPHFFTGFKYQNQFNYDTRKKKWL